MQGAIDEKQSLSLPSSVALVVVDVQNDFLPGGRLAVPDGDTVIAPLNVWLYRFRNLGRPIFLTRDWHPADHCSFSAQGGTWPTHCVSSSSGAAFAAGLTLHGDEHIVSKAVVAKDDSYSAFQNTDFATRLRTMNIGELYIGGLATDYCVLQTVLDALNEGFQVRLLSDAIRAVNVKPDDGKRAIVQMCSAGAVPLTLEASV